jgi:hypothetical protein
MKRMTLALTLAFLVGCAVTAGHAIPDAESLAAVTGEDLDTLRRGRASYVRSCAECHRLYFPGEYTPAEWDRIAPEMGDRAGLGGRETAELTTFLRAAAARPDDPAPPR